MPKQVFTGPFFSIQIREYDPKNPEFNREVQGSMTPRDSNDSRDNETQEAFEMIRAAQKAARAAQKEAKEDDKKSCRSVTTSSTRCGSSKFSDNDNDRSTEFSQESEQDAFSQEKQAEQASSSKQNTEQKPTHQQSAPSGVPSNPNAQQPNQNLSGTIKMSL